VLAKLGYVTFVKSGLGPDDLGAFSTPWRIEKVRMRGVHFLGNGSCQCWLGEVGFDLDKKLQ
jgi:hypothetical protein